MKKSRWIYRPDFLPNGCVETEDHKRICDLEDRKFGPLISAAPELLEACKAALGAFEHNHAINWDDLARAIAKAERRDK